MDSFDIFCMISSYACDQHLGLQISNIMNTNNQPNDKKNNHFPCNPNKKTYVKSKSSYWFLI